MKVCTDACILGASITIGNEKTVLDIGTGTGILSLMYAQRGNAKITAVEIDKNAFLQASQNVLLSPWKDRVEVVHTDVNSYVKESKAKFDLIISNPPFFQQSLKSPDSFKNVAKHDNSLKLIDLVSIIDQLLNPEGSAWILLPEPEINLLKSEFEKKGIVENQRLNVRNTTGKPVFRVISTFSRTNYDPIVYELVIKENGAYTVDFRKLLKDYYLIF